MAGIFSPSNLPKRPGAYFRFIAREAEQVLSPSQGIVALGATHSWGPENQVVQLDGFEEFLAIYGQGGTTPPAYTNGYRAVRDAFKGEGLPGYGGAGRVLFYRIVGTGGAKSAKTLNNTAPAAAITLTARYKGTYGDKISFTVVADATDPTNYHNLVVLVEGVEAERYRYLKTDITDLAAQINGTTPYSSLSASDWVTAGSVTSGTALTTVTASAATGGNDGTVAAGDYTAAMTAFEPYRFSVFGFDNLTDASVVASLKTWAVNLNSKGKRFVSVVGGAAGETVATAITRSASLADPSFVNVGGGTYTDANYGDLSTAQLVPRIAGIIAQRGEGAEITFARLAGLEIKVGATESDIVNALAGGVVVISRDSNPDAPVRVELGITTFTSTTDAARPLSIYSQLKFIRIMGGIETDLTEFAESNVVGKMPVNESTRDYVRGQVEARLAEREAAQIIQPGWRVSVSQNPPPSPTDNFVALDITVTFERGVQAVLHTVTTV